MPSVFISYDHSDQEFAQWIGRELKDHGAFVWFDETHIKAGDSLISTISAGIRSVDFVVVVLSPASVNSWWVTEETNLAISRKIPVIPLMLAECEPPGFLETRAYLKFLDKSQHKEMLHRLLVRLELETTGSSSSIAELLKTQREFLTQPIEIEPLIMALGITSLVALLGAFFFVLLNSTSFLDAVATRLLGETPEWIRVIGLGFCIALSIAVTVLLMKHLNYLFPKVTACLENVYIRFRHAPRLARIACHNGIEKSLAIQAYESAVGTQGMVTFMIEFDRCRQRRNANNRVNRSGESGGI